MKSNKIFIALVVLVSLFVTSNASAQGVFEYGTKKCKYTQIVPENKDRDWEKTGKNEYAPLSENARLHQVAEKCSGWYFQPGIFGAYTSLTQDIDANTSVSAKGFSPKAELVIGYDFCTGHKDGIHPRNFAVSVEAKIQLTKVPTLVYKDLTYTKDGYVPTVGANLVLQLSKHKPWQVAIYGGAGYTRLTSYYPQATEVGSVDRISHNTLAWEAGIQIMKRVKIGHSIGIKAGYEKIQTTKLGRGQFSIGLVWKFKKTHKSKSMSYGDYLRLTH